MDNLIPAFLKELRQTQFQPREWLLDYQRRLLAALLQHARAHVPFYRDSGRLAPLLQADGGIRWDRWGEIPLLTRRDVQQNFEALKAERLPPEHGNTWTLTTSGSTGEPVSVLHTTMSGRVAWTAQMLRDFERYRIDPRERLAFLRPAKTSTTTNVTGASGGRGAADEGRAPHYPKPRQGWYPQLAELGMRGERFDIADTLPAPEMVKAVASVRPVYLRVQPIALEIMCAHDRDSRLSDLGIEAVFTVGDGFSADAKRAVSLHLGCRIMDHYASQECGRIAASCPGCGQFHVDADINVVDVIDDTGAPALPGETGCIVVTPLYNYAMPLIRYDHGDRVKVGAPDECTIKLPALEAIYGKEREPFRFTDGTVIRPTLDAGIVVECLGAQAYQFAQVAHDRCEIRFVPGSMQFGDMKFEKLTEHLRSVWWRGLQVEYRPVDAITRRTPRAKVPIFVSEIDEATLANAAKAT